LDECLEEKNFGLIEKLRAYYSFKDVEEGLNNYYEGIFNALCNSHASYDEIAAKFFIDVKTLFKYRNKIDLLAEALSNVKHFNAVQSGDFDPIENQLNTLQ